MGLNGPVCWRLQSSGLRTVTSKPKTRAVRRFFLARAKCHDLAVYRADFAENASYVRTHLANRKRRQKFTQDSWRSHTPHAVVPPVLPRRASSCALSVESFQRQMAAGWHPMLKLANYPIHYLAVPGARHNYRPLRPGARRRWRVVSARVCPPLPCETIHSYSKYY